MDSLDHSLHYSDSAILSDNMESYLMGKTKKTVQITFRITKAKCNLTFFFYRIELKKLDEELKRVGYYVENSIQIKFTLVPARAGIRGNEEADKLAKEGAVKFARLRSGDDNSNSNVDENQRYFSYFNTGVISVCLSSILIWHLLRKRGNI